MFNGKLKNETIEKNNFFSNLVKKHLGRNKFLMWLTKHDLGKKIITVTSDIKCKN